MSTTLIEKVLLIKWKISVTVVAKKISNSGVPINTWNVQVQNTTSQKQHSSLLSLTKADRQLEGGRVDGQVDNHGTEVRECLYVTVSCSLPV